MSDTVLDRQSAARGGEKSLVDIDAYFARIGYRGPATATLATLRALHELHPDAIAFEAIDVQLGRGITRLTVRAPDGRTEHRILSADEIEQALAETFGLRVEADWRRVIERAARVAPAG